MAYVESFARAMERARQSVSYWDRKTLDHLQAAHDAEMRQCSKSEYHRGFEDGKVTRDADQWQLDRARKSVVARLRKVVPSEQHGSHEMLSAICTAISKPVMGWTVGAGELLRDQLIALLGAQDTPNATDFAGNQQNGPKSGEKAPEMQRDEPKSRDSLQEVEPSSIADERHKAVCELQKLRERNVHIWEIEICIALGLGLDASNEDLCDRLIHLLGGDDETASNDDRTCPIAIQSSSITDELRTWVRDLMPASGTLYIVGGSTLDELMAIADRIDEQFNRMCEQHESVLQQTVSETVDEHEREMAELRHDIEMWRDRAEDMRMERDDLRAELRVANQTHECNRKLAKRNEQWCDALLDLIRDAAEDYQIAARVARRLQERTSELRRERDDLLDKLQAISVLCEQDDG